jgi:hypothetical protein
MWADYQLREDPDALLAEQARALDAALGDVAAQVSAGALDAQVDDQGRLHVPAYMRRITPLRL